MTLSELVDQTDGATLIGDGSVEVAGITSDSRKVREGEVFVAVPGFERDGASYATDAVERGAVAVVTEVELELDRVPVVRVENARKAAAEMAAVCLGHPSRSLELIGVTGTSGKTTTTRMIESILDQTGAPVGLIGTIEYRAGSVRESADRTTPDSVELQEWFARMVEENVERAVMEVSSHALALHRTWGVEFDVAVFTNLSRDHFDFHEDFEDYFGAKRMLFDQIPAEGKRAVVNADDEYGRRLIAELGRDRVISFGRAESADVRPAEDFATDISGLHGTVHTPWGDVEVRSPLLGEPNLYNWMAAIGASLVSGVSIEQVERGIAAIERIDGRFERVLADSRPPVIVDYAHKPDALEKLLVAVRELSPDSPIVLTFGCGGDRDKGKRPLMGEVAAKKADVIILTSDNPRSEDPEAIIAGIREGIDRVGHDQVRVVEERREAIRLAIEEAPEDAVVVIAGKGHEDYQVIGDQIIHFDDREEARFVLQKKR